MRSVPLVGPSYNLESRPASVQRTINLMPVPLEPGNERTAWVLKDVPGLTVFEAEPAPPVVQIQPLLLYNFEQPDTSFAFVDEVGHSVSDTSSGSGVNATRVTTAQAKFGTGSLGIKTGTQVQLGRGGATAAASPDEFKIAEVSWGAEWFWRIDSSNPSTSIEIFYGSISGAVVDMFRVFYVGNGVDTHRVDIDVFDNVFMTTPIDFTFDAWHMFALTHDYDAELVRFFFDGEMLLEVSTAGANFPAYDIFEPCLVHDGTNGIAWVDAIRLVRDDPVYTASFTPPVVAHTAPTDPQADPSTLNGGATLVQLVGLGNSVGANTVDDTGKIVTITGASGADFGFSVGDSALTDSDGCIDFTSTSSSAAKSPRFEVQACSDLDLLGTDWTVEFFFRRSAVTYSGNLRFPGPTGNAFPAWLRVGFGGSIAAVVNNGIDSVSCSDDLSFPILGSWNHIAFVREGGMLSLYVNGDRQTQTAIAFDIPAKTLNWPSVTAQFLGTTIGESIRVDGIRVSNSAIYSGATISVPTSYA